MCTLTVISGRQGLVVTMNRDELRTRREVGTLLTGHNDITGLSYCYPIDGLHGGTWFGCNSAGIVLALLNRYQEKNLELMESRGMIITTLISYGNITEMLQALRDGVGRLCNPYDLIIVDSDTRVRCTWDGSTCRISDLQPSSAFLLSSSSVLPERTMAYRQELFRKWLEESEDGSMDSTQILARYHLQQDPADPSSSVLMSRPLSHTKSVSQARISNGKVELVYLDEATLRDLTPGVVPREWPVHRLMSS